MKYIDYVVKLLLAVVAISTLSIAGLLLFKHDSNAAPAPVNRPLCIAYTDQQALECNEGDLLLARTVQGSENASAAAVSTQVLNSIALYCDLNHPVHHNDAGVLCVLTHQRAVDQE